MKKTDWLGTPPAKPTELGPISESIRNFAEEKRGKRMILRTEEYDKNLPPKLSVEDVFGQIQIELEKVKKKHKPFNSPHEGWAIMLEEVDELWEHVRANTGRGVEAKKEAIQIAVAAIRYITDL